MGSHLIHSESTVIVRLILSQTLGDQFKSQQQKACSEKNRRPVGVQHPRGDTRFQIMEAVKDGDPYR